MHPIMGVIWEELAMLDYDIEAKNSGKDLTAFGKKNGVPGKINFLPPDNLHPLTDASLKVQSKEYWYFGIRNEI